MYVGTDRSQTLVHACLADQNARRTVVQRSDAGILSHDEPGVAVKASVLVEITPLRGYVKPLGIVANHCNRARIAQCHVRRNLQDKSVVGALVAAHALSVDEDLGFRAGALELQEKALASIRSRNAQPPRIRAVSSVIALRAHEVGLVPGVRKIDLLPPAPIAGELVDSPSCGNALGEIPALVDADHLSGPGGNDYGQECGRDDDEFECSHMVCVYYVMPTPTYCGCTEDRASLRSRRSGGRFRRGRAASLRG